MSYNDQLHSGFCHDAVCLAKTQDVAYSCNADTHIMHGGYAFDFMFVLSLGFVCPCHMPMQDRFGLLMMTQLADMQNLIACNSYN